MYNLDSLDVSFIIRITLTLEKPNSPIILSKHHNAIIQSAIYSSLSSHLETFFHDKI